MNNIREQIILKMAEKGMSQDTLAQKSNVSRPTISKMIKGEDWTKSCVIRVLEALELNELINLLK